MDTSQLRFEKFTGGYGKRQPKPRDMCIGEIALRSGISRAYISMLRSDMRKAMDRGMSFSVHDSGDVFAIRRDA